MIVAALALGAGAADAQNACGDRAMILGSLSEKYGETVRVQGQMTGGRVMEIYANPETGTWTAVITMPDGVTTCIAAAGQGFVVPDVTLDPAAYQPPMPWERDV